MQRNGSGINNYDDIEEKLNLLNLSHASKEVDMYKIGDEGNWKILPESAATICDGDFAKLDQLLEEGLDINVPIVIDQYISLLPLEIAVFRNSYEMVKFLLEKGADPDRAKYPLLLSATRYCDRKMMQIFSYQAEKLDKKQKMRIFNEVRWGKQLENLSYIEEMGISISEYGGEAFRAAVSDGDEELSRLLFSKGADIDYHEPDMVFPYASTPVIEAARNNDFKMVCWLVENGADITIMDKHGERPYTLAIENKNSKMADYLKALEPEAWHNEQEKLHQLKAYKIPGKMVQYLKTGPLHLEFPEHELVRWAELYSFMDLQEITWKRKKLISLMMKMDNYSDILLLWNPKDRKLWYLDLEHEEFHPLAKWEEFINDPGSYLNGMIEGRFETKGEHQ